jgi:hypothetical protein
MVHFKRTTKNSTVSWNNVTPGAESGDMLWQYCLRNNFTLKKFFVDLPYHIVSSYSSLTVFVAFKKTKKNKPMARQSLREVSQFVD